MLEKFKTCKKVVGMKQSVKMIEEGKTSVVFIAKDSDSRIISKLEDMCHRYGVEISYLDTMKQLGCECGIEVGASVACILK